jgi:hypothetical protein
MPFTIPDKGEGANDIQSILFQEYLEVLAAGMNCDFVLDGCACTAQGSPDMTVAVAKGSVISNGNLFPVTAGNVTIGAADGSNPRLDLIVANNAGTKAVRAGTAAAAPKPPARSANDVVLAVVYVPASDTTIAANQITDLRVLRTQGPILLKKVTADVLFNTTAVIQTYFSITIPNGLLVAGKKLRVHCGGNYLANTATPPTLILTISFGAVTMFVSAASATLTQDADRGAWNLIFDITAQTNTDQALTGLISVQTPGAKTNSTGRGSLAVATHINSPINGAGTADTNTADRDLLVRWTMSVSSASHEIVMEHATCELL